MVNILDLPDEVIRYVSKFLMIEDLKRLSTTCKLLYHLFPSYMIEERVIYGPDINEAGPSSDESWQPSKYFDTPPFTSSIFMATISAYWNDQGWGNRKGSIYAQLIRRKTNSEEIQVIAEHLDLFGDSPHKAVLFFSSGSSNRFNQSS